MKPVIHPFADLSICELLFGSSAFEDRREASDELLPSIAPAWIASVGGLLAQLR